MKGYNYSQGGSVPDTSGAIFRVGNSKKASDIIKGLYNDHPPLPYSINTFTCGPKKFW